jgi:hypothetical protein
MVETPPGRLGSSGSATRWEADGELTMRPLPPTEDEQPAEIRGRAKLNSLLEGPGGCLR